MMKQQSELHLRAVSVKVRIHRMSLGLHSTTYWALSSSICTITAAASNPLNLPARCAEPVRSTRALSFVRPRIDTMILYNICFDRLVQASFRVVLDFIKTNCPQFNAEQIRLKYLRLYYYLLLCRYIIILKLVSYNVNYNI